MGSPGQLQLGCSRVDPVPGQLTEHCQPPLPASLPCSWPHWGTDPGGEENAAPPTPAEGACKPWLPHSASLIALC